VIRTRNIRLENPVL